MHLLDRGDDARVRAAAADVAAHPLADLVVREARGRRRHVVRDVARVAAACLLEETNGRADLTGCTVAALEGVVLDERRLHGVQLVASREPLDGRDLLAL